MRVPYDEPALHAANVANAVSDFTWYPGVHLRSARTYKINIAASHASGALALSVLIRHHASEDFPADHRTLADAGLGRSHIGIEP